MDNFNSIITTHRNTDFDALASVVAANLLYPDAKPVLPRNLNVNVKAFLSLHKELFRMYAPNEIDPDAVKHLVVVDINRWGRLEGFKGLANRDDLEIILWDHHLSNTDIDADWKCQEAMGATISLLVRQLKTQKISLTPMQATLFLIGLYEDTGQLTFAGTKSDDARAAAYLLDNGADLGVLSSFLRPGYGAAHKDVLFEILEKASSTSLNGYNVSIFQIVIGGHIDGLAMVVRMFRELLNLDAAFGIFSSQQNNKCMVIGRSDHEGLNVGSIMRSLGGGGHPGAGSAMLKAVNPDAVASMIQELIQGNQEASVQISDMMSSPVYTIRPDISMQKAKTILDKEGYTGLPVIDDKTLIGVISKRDIRKIKNPRRLNAPVKGFMSRRVRTISPDKNPSQAARLMVKYDIGRLPVLDEDKLIGIITRSDVMKHFYHSLQERGHQNA
ncbi:CBS domain-containing protein [Desulfococcaceae bacterium HSG9]|nr:CBS domain-containing protein [Desulfococcaceae bacterium HSG9]